MELDSHLRTMTNSDGAAILNTSAGTITTMNATAAFIWGGLQRGESPSTITAALAHTTHSTEDEIRADVDAFIAELQRHSLLAEGRLA